MMISNDTIVAVATPSGRGGIGIVRLSGKNSQIIALTMTQMDSFQPRHAHFSSIYSESKQVLDKGIVIYFNGPHSFTGEDVIEFHVHGSPFVLESIVHAALKLNARLAEPGEFSYRAFMNNKMDLAEAEAVSDLIHASSEKAAQLALRTLQGEFSAIIHDINQKIVYLRTFVEAMIDFPDEEIDVLTWETITQKYIEVINQLNDLFLSAKQGSLLREGVKVVFCGKPNAGKSSLINWFAKKDIAIVTSIPGTTRDLKQEYILLDDIPMIIIDTAGLRDSDDEVEQEGIRRAKEALLDADCVLLISDVMDNEKNTFYQDIALKISRDIPIIHVVNKIDLSDDVTLENQELLISIKKNIGLDSLKEQLKKAVGYQPVEGTFLARKRHLDALTLSREQLDAGLLLLQKTTSLELIAEHLHLSHQALCKITGEFTSDDLLGAIFSSFCIGK